MTGRRVILTNRAFTHEELGQFLDANWDAGQYNSFITDPSLKRYTDHYFLLPASPRYMVIVYSRAAGGLFSKKDKVVLSVMNTPEGMTESLLRSIPTQNVFFGAAKIAGTMSAEKERKGPAEDALQRYTDYMTELLRKAGYLK